MIIAYYFIYFVIYSFIGWLYETIICSIGQKKLVNRGFLNAPICPIYGFGAIIAIFALYGHTDNIIIIFFVSMLLASILEYFTSWLMEKLFHMRWWDYTDQPFNINGRVYLLGALVFATLCVLLITLVHPLIEALILQAPPLAVSIATAVLAVIIFIDTFFTVANLIKLDRALAEFQKNFNLFLDSYIKRSIIFYDDLVSQFEASKLYSPKLKKRISSIRRHQIRRFVKIFPKANSKRYTEAWKSIKHDLKTLPPKPKSKSSSKISQKKPRRPKQK